jgi:hypothetical protein
MTVLLLDADIKPRVALWPQLDLSPQVQMGLGHDFRQPLQPDRSLEAARVEDTSPEIGTV